VSTVRQRSWDIGSNEEPLRRVLSVLYADWFRFDDLCPNLFWLVEVEAALFVPVPTLPECSPRNVRRAFVLDHGGIYHRSVQDWLRFQTIHFTRPWDATGNEGLFIRSLGLLEPRKVVFAVGFGSFAVDSLGGIYLDLTFGPRYGRGYYLNHNGALTSRWAS
jgi:hypothetical protein